MTATHLHTVLELSQARCAGLTAASPCCPVDLATKFCLQVATKPLIGTLVPVVDSLQVSRASVRAGVAVVLL